MKSLLKAEVLLLDNGQIQFQLDGHVDRHAAVGMLEDFKTQILSQKGNSVKSSISELPALAPKRF